MFPLLNKKESTILRRSPVAARQDSTIMTIHVLTKKLTFEVKLILMAIGTT